MNVAAGPPVQGDIGRAGVGKNALAVHTAHWVAEELPDDKHDADVR